MLQKPMDMYAQNTHRDINYYIYNYIISLLITVLLLVLGYSTISTLVVY